MNRFESDFNHFTNVVLAGEGITEDTKPEEYTEQVNRFIERNATSYGN